VRLRSVLTLCRVLALVAFGVCASATDQATLSAHDREVILKTVDALRAAILSGNADAFLQHVSTTQGLTCTDTKYSYKDITRFLADKRSHLYMGLFDSPSFAQACGREYPPEYPAISDREFLKTANAAVTITTVRKGWVEVTINSPVPSHYPRMWYLHKEGEAWKLAGDGVIIGSCSCG
jgi:hypothetical protein